MGWTTTGDIHEFVGAAGRYLASGPVDNTVLLTEAAYLTAGPLDPDDQQYGWWRDESDEVTAAFVAAPRHPPVLSPMSRTALDELVDVLPAPRAVGVDAMLADDAVESWSRAGTRLVARSRIGLHRLARPVGPPRAAGVARTAVAADRALLDGWFDQMMAAHPEDPSDRAYVVDDPLECGGITLWEVDGRPVAMAGRSRLVAGMVRVGAAFEVQPGAGHADAALAVCVAAAASLAEHVLVFVGSDDDAGTHLARELGFVHVLDRVMLTSS